MEHESCRCGHSACCTAQAEAASPPAEPQPSGKRVVLVVDDDMIVRDLCRRMLERMGLTVVMADSGLQAVEWFRCHGASVHCVLIDLTMPEPDGIQTARLLRDMQAKIPIVLMSGYSEEEIHEQCTTSCFNAFLQKPFSIQALFDMMKTTLG